MTISDRVSRATVEALRREAERWRRLAAHEALDGWDAEAAERRAVADGIDLAADLLAAPSSVACGGLALRCRAVTGRVNDSFCGACQRAMRDHEQEQKARRA